MSKRAQRILFLVVFVLILAVFFVFIKPKYIHIPSTISPSELTELDTLGGYAGSRSCRECHERFYQLWSPSHHGKAMQPMADVIHGQELAQQQDAIKVGDSWFQVSIEGDKLFMLEKKQSQPEKVLKKYEAVWALGGRNIFYFLTPFEGGRLQTLPLAYDINKHEWYGNPQSAVRHFVDEYAHNEALEWTNPLYTFNTTCHSCHVSQLSKNYDNRTNTYHTTWKEPGINCETCHGPCEEHVRACRQAALNNEEPTDLKIIKQSQFTAEQHNASCAACHAKGMLLTNTYTPGEPFFQHFDLVTLENPDFYPDGRDLGEDYTMTSWMQSKCALNSDLHCVSCHTSSGRYRFKGHDNDACMQCHEKKVNQFEAHSRHQVKDSLTCISCHLPKTSFARMTRSDHSMRPPMPAATIKYQSPNACNLCHQDKDAQWANKYVTKWHGDYQDETLNQARLIYEGRNGNFKHADQMLTMVDDPEVNVIFRNSMIRILMNFNGAQKERHLLKAFEDRSPLIRASVVQALQAIISNDSKAVLLRAARDSFRIVRIRASMALALFPDNMFTPQEKAIVESNYKEYTEYLTSYPDNWSAYYNLGNFYHGRGMYQDAIKSFDKAEELDNSVISPLVNASVTYSMLNDNTAAEQKLKRALEIEPKNAAGNLNYGLLLAQMQRYEEAVYHLKIAMEQDSIDGTAAYNLAVMSAQSADQDQALKYSLRAYRINPENPKYGYTYAYYLNESGQVLKAISVLNEVLGRHADYVDGYLFLASIYESNHNLQAAVNTYIEVSKIESLPVEYRQNILDRANVLKQAIQ